MTLTAPDEPDPDPGGHRFAARDRKTLDKVPAGQQLVREQVSSYLSGSLAGLAQRGLGAVLPFDRVSVDPGQSGAKWTRSAIQSGEGRHSDLF